RPSPPRSARHCACIRRGRSGPGCVRSGEPCRRRDWPLSWTAVTDAAEVAYRILLVLLPHRGGGRQFVPQFGVVLGVLFIALASQLEQLASGVAQLAEDRTERVQAGLDRGMR